MIGIERPGVRDDIILRRHLVHDPHAEVIPEGKAGAPLASAKVRMQQFLMAHTPVRA